MISDYWQRFESWTWDHRLDTLPLLQRWAVMAVRLVRVLIQDITDGQITMRAMGLVYTSLLSLAPLLAVAFSMLKAFGMEGVMRPMLERLLMPLGEGSDTIVDNLVGFVDNMKVGVLGALGVALLLYAVISLIQKVEMSCNYVWQVRKVRSLGRRFSEYISVLVVAPLLIVTAGSMTASVTSNALVQNIAEIEPFGTTLLLIGKLAPYFLWSVGFTLLFLFMPNTRVRPLPAMAGGAVSGILWQTASLTFANFASGGSNYNAIYASFAILIFLLIWLYLSWLIMLLGCRVAFLLQHPEQLARGEYPPRAGAAREESLALRIMGLVAHAYVNHQPPWSIDRLAEHLYAVPAHVSDIVDRLVEAGMLIETGEEADTVVPQGDIDTLDVDDVLQVARAGAPHAEYYPREDGTHHRVTDVLTRLGDARREALSGITVRQLADTHGPPTDSDPAPAG